MMTDLRIRNFKLFKDFSLKNIPRILLLGGRNNCGKTSLLEAVFFALDSAHETMFWNNVSRRGLDVIPSTPDGVFAPLYRNFNLDDPMVFEFDLDSSAERKRLSYTFMPSSRTRFSPDATVRPAPRVDTWTDRGQVEIAFGADGQGRAFLELGDHEFRMDPKAKLKMLEYIDKTKVAFVHTSGVFISKSEAEFYSDLEQGHATEPVLESLRILEPRLRSLDVVVLEGDNPVLHGDIGIGRMVPLPFMGEGVRRLLSLILWMSRLKGGVLLVDEIETGFHHSVLPKVWEELILNAKANDIQIMATTHSREMIAGAMEGVPEDMRGDLEYIRIDRSDEKIDAKRFDFESLQNVFKLNWAIR